MDFYTKDKKRLYYEVINDSGEMGTLVFLNGALASTNSWYNQYKALIGQGYRVVLHDFVGQLMSDKFEETYSFSKHSKDLYELLDYLQVKDVHLIGTSYGGVEAMKYATMYPDRIRSLTIINSTSEKDDRLVRTIEEWIELASSYEEDTFFYEILPSIYGYDYIKNNKSVISGTAKWIKEQDDEYFEGQIGLYKTYINELPITKELNKIKCPTLILCGKDDTLNPVRFSEIIHENIMDSKLVVLPNCGHVAIMEKPDEVNKLLIEFLNRK